MEKTLQTEQNPPPKKKRLGKNIEKLILLYNISFLKMVTENFAGDQCSHGIGIRSLQGSADGEGGRDIPPLHGRLLAGVTSAMGGIAGIIMGYGLSSVATSMIVMLLETKITVSPSITSVLRAFGISAGIGVLFGYLPAKKAANLNPIDALRYD